LLFKSRVSAILQAPMWFLERNTISTPGLRAVVQVAFLLAFLASVAGSAAAVEPATPVLKVSGKAAFVTEARATSDGFEVRATLSDEVGRPLPGAEIRARAATVETNATLHRCGDPRGEAGAELLLTTDKSGRVCITVTGMPSGTVELGFQDARGYLERANRVVRLPDDVATSFELGFDPPVTTLLLDQPLQELGLVARALGNAPPPAAAELVLALSADGHERELGRAALDGLGEVHRLSLVSASFGEPGPARLVARLRARDGSELAQASTAVMRTASVALHVGSESEAGVEPGATLQVHAASVLGPAPSGVIEARSRGLSVAAAHVQNGTAILNLPAAPAALLGGSLTLEYVGEGAGWLSGPPLELHVQPASPSYARYALWIAAAALAALAVVLGWRRPARPRPGATTLPPRPRASIELLETFGSGGGYRGFVRDAHEGSGISPAVLTFIGPGSHGPVLLQARTSSDGAFEVPAAAFPAGTMVEVAAPFHATLRAVLPVPGVLELSLVSRRRALLERLVRWAEQRGKPWTRPSGDPTPAQIVEAAAGEGEPQVERWARGLENLAFGPTPPDASSEQAAGVLEDPKVGRE
jgi:hypothetical protein